MAIRYRNRERRLERTISRIETARRAIAGHTKTASEHEAWWRRHGGTLEAWRSAIAERQHRQPATGRRSQPIDSNGGRPRLRWHPTVLRLRLECWWLTRKLGGRGDRDEADDDLPATASSAFDRRFCGRSPTGAIRRRPAFFAAAAPRWAASPRSRPLFVLLTRAGLLPLPALDVLYVLHDYAALPFWGYTWTLLAPYSITWWSLAGIGARRLARNVPHPAIRGARASRAPLSRRGRSPRGELEPFATTTSHGSRRGSTGSRRERSAPSCSKTSCASSRPRRWRRSSSAAPTLDEHAAWRLVRLTDLLARLTSCAARAGARALDERSPSGIRR